MRSISASVIVRGLLALAIMLASLASLPWTSTAQAAPIPAGDVSALIAAISAANLSNEPTTIELTENATYTLTTGFDVSSDPTGLPAITGDITILGNGATITRSSGAETPIFRILRVNGGNLTLDSVSVTNGDIGDDAWTGIAGGIYVLPGSTLMILDSTISGHSAYTGGAIFSATATVDIINSTISNNTALTQGGGINSDLDTVLTVINSTIAGNYAGAGGGIIHFGQTTVTNSTISDNDAWAFGGGMSGHQVTQLDNTIIAGNRSPESPDVAGSASGSNNLIGDSQYLYGIRNGVDGNIVGTSAAPIDALLAPLADNGGPTETMALLPGSPAIAAANAATSPSTDQRGVSRPTGNAPDIGAYELDSITYSEICTVTRQFVRQPVLALSACATLAVARIADRPGSNALEQRLLNTYRVQIRFMMVRQLITTPNGQQLIDLSYIV